MALIKCKECGSEVSSSASTCPKCGSVVVSKSNVVGFIAACLLGWMVFSLLTGEGSTHTVTYSVTGSTSKAALTYQNGQGGTQQEKVYLPWSKTFTAKGGAFVYLSAQNENPSGSITVSISADGKEFKRSDAVGGYTIASASGSCCD